MKINAVLIRAPTLVYVLIILLIAKYIYIYDGVDLKSKILF